MTPANLFGVEKPAKAKKAAAPASETQRIIGAWARLFEAKYGEKPIVNGKDAAAVKRLIGHAGAAVVERRLGLYLALEDDFVAGQGYPLSLMLGQWNRLVALERPVQRGNQSVEATDAYLRGLKGGRS